jgi:hypothetical protein
VKIRNIKTPSHWQRLEYHPFSDLTEFGLGIDTEAVIDHMARHGWDRSERITLFEGKILDGRHKHSCAQRAEVEPRFQEFLGSHGEALAFVKKKLLRQHLTTDQRAMVAAKLATLANGCRPSSKEEGGAMTREQAAAECGTNTAALDRAKALLTKCVPAIQRAYRTNEVSLTDAASVASLPTVQQEKALDALRLGKISTLAEWAKKHKPKRKQKKVPKNVVTDGTGRVVPDMCRDAFADTGLPTLIAELEQAASFVHPETWTGRATKLTDHYGFLLLEKFHEHVYEALNRLELAAEALRAGLPYAVCPNCDGGKEGCRTCRGHGHVPEHRYKEVTSEPV